MSDDLSEASGEIIVAVPEARTLARNILRRWLRDPADAVLDGIGSTEIRESVDAAQRLHALVEAGSPRMIVTEIERIASTCDALTRSAPRRWLPSRHPPTRIVTADEIGAVAACLEAEADESKRRMITLASTKDRMTKKAERLDEVLTLIRTMRPMIESAARELRGDQPSLASDLRDRGVGKLLEREQALLTQKAIHQQAMMTLDLLVFNQTSLDQAIVQARTATLSALQVAIAARQVMSDQRQIDPSVAAERARNKLHMALAEARQAIEAVPASANAISPLDL